jgi:hypothetical protein
MVDHVETGHEEVGETGPLYRHVFGMRNPPISPIPIPYANRINTHINYDRAWSSPSAQPSEPTGNTKATPKTNCTSGASACRPSGTLPKSQGLSSCNVFPCCGRWSAMSGRRLGRRCLRRCRRRGGWGLRMTLRWKGWSSSGIMRSKDFVCSLVIRAHGVSERACTNNSWWVGRRFLGYEIMYSVLINMIVFSSLTRHRRTALQASLE